MNFNFVPATTLQAEVSLLLNDTLKNRWTQAMLDAAYNYAVSEWNQRINVPVIIDSTIGWSVSNWSANTAVYPLPLGIDAGMVVPQYLSTAFDSTGIPAPTNSADTWVDIATYTVEPPSDGTGVWKLRFPTAPYDSPARLLAHIGNTRIPIAPAQLAVQMPATVGGNAVTDVTFQGSKSGFVLIGGEGIGYAGVQGVNMLNLVRNVDGFGIAVHAIGSTVTALLALEEQQDRAGFVDTVIGACHRMYLNNASSADQNFHQQMVTYYDNRVLAFWRRRSPQRSTRLVLTDFSYWN